MNYEQFLEQLKEDLTARFAADLPPELSDVRIGIRDVEKLQGESYRGLSFRSGDSPVEANLNMIGAFQAYEEGRPYQDILQEVEDQLMKIVDRTPQFNIGELSDYEAMKPKLMMEVIPQNGNEDRLANIPHQKVEDMALIYRIDMGDSNGGKMTSVITNQQLKAFGITAEQLHQDALENAPLTHPASLRSMREVMADMMGMEPEEPMPGEPTMLVATVEGAFMGASVIQYPGFMEQAAEKIGGDFFVLPSSIHEVLIIPDDGHQDYDAKAAQRLYEELRTSSREGLNISGSRLRSIDKVVLPLITQGQSPYMIVTNHPELGLSVRTLYRYIDLGVLLSRNIDLKRKVKFKLRKSDVKKQIVNRAVFQGRTYDDFKALGLSIEEFVEMDTVLSARGSDKCILTIYFPDIELLVAHLMQRCTEGAVKLVFDQLQKSLGGSEEFIQYFPYILTDRGHEFGDPDSLEFDRNGHARTKIYYCDPMRSNQKAGIENVHTMLRMILPKGTAFTDLTQWDIRKAVDHINNAPRENLGGKTPYEKALWLYGKEFLKKLQLRYVAPDEVTLTPKLLSK